MPDAGPHNQTAADDGVRDAVSDCAAGPASAELGHHTSNARAADNFCTTLSD